MVSPKYARVQSGIVNLIAAKKIRAGGMLPTEKQLSKHFDVSIITIRRAVKNLEENKILRREQGRGTFVITDIQGQVDNGTITFLEILPGNLATMGFNLATKMIDAELSRRGYRMNFLAAGQEPDQEALSRLRDVSGVIVTGHVNAKWVQILRAIDIPMVFAGEINCGSLGIPVVSADYKGMAAMLATLLFEKGAKKIGLLIGSLTYAPAPLMRDGLVSVMKARGEKLDPALIFYSDHEMPLSSSYNIGKYLAANPDLDSFLMDEGCYVHVINNLFNSRRRPLMGVMSEKPHYGIVCKNTYEAAFKGDMYFRAIELLIELILTGRKSSENIRLEPYVVS